MITSRVIAIHEYANSHGSTPSRKLTSIDEMATTLGVKRRRIYDIVNVLESLNIASRAQEGKYTWNGVGAVAKTLSGLILKFGPPSVDSTAQPGPSNQVRVRPAAV